MNLPDSQMLSERRKGDLKNKTFNGDIIVIDNEKDAPVNETAE